MLSTTLHLNDDSKNSVIKRSIFKHFLKKGKASIPALAKELNYSVPTMTKYVAELSDDGYLKDYGKVETKEGRYPNIYGVNPDSFYFVGVDIRWFSLSIGVINFSGDLLKVSINRNFIFSKNPEMLDDICTQVNKFIDDIEKDKTLSIDRSKISNVNVNISGRVNPKTGYSFSIFNTGEVPLSEVLTQKLGINTIIDNDTRAMAFGEFSQVYQEKVSNLIFINVGWGLGMGIIIDGEMYCGKSGYSGEIGHTNIFDNEILCHCGKKGCLETEVSGFALHREIISRINEGTESTLSKSVKEGKNIGIDDIISAIVEKEDMLCIEVLDEIGAKLGKQIANYINMFNPEVVVIGGVLSETGEYLLLPIKAAIRKYSLSLISNDSKVIMSQLKDRAGVTGACLLARDRNLEE